MNDILDEYQNLQPSPYRQAADHIWKMAEEYRAKGMRDLSETLKGISQEIHDLARTKEISNNKT